MHSLRLLDFALVVADVVILLERSIYYPSSSKKAGARIKRPYLSSMEVMCGFVRTNSGTRCYDRWTGSRDLGRRKGDHIHVGILTRSEPFFLFFT